MEGRRIGAYRVMRELGRGGMGAVYLGSRADAAYEKLVAIKVVLPPLDLVSAVRRFREERQILATLDHPNIARLFDGGSTEEGLPYFVMEYIEGQAIDRWCNERKLTVTSRLELFQSVCSAVSYAHHLLIVHLDLKPANILVTPDGVVKLLDFGIARLLRSDDDTVRAAAVGRQLRMTPEYASPEQIKGAVLGTSSDLYSLGVVLYELLTGHRPYRLHSQIVHEIARVICEEEPTRPSTVVVELEDRDEDGSAEARLTPDAVSEVREGTPARLRRRLQGDLDNILLTALRKEPSRRYESVERFAEDLRRHVESFPVRARPHTLRYRAEKFVRRNPVGVIAAVLVVAMLGAGVATTLWQERLALAGQLQRVLLPQFALYSFANLVAFVVVLYFSRATFRRVVGAWAAASGFVLYGFVVTRVAQHRWWEVAVSVAQLPPGLLVGNALCYVATLALVSWRASRRFGWRGQAAFVAVMSVWGPARDYLGASMTQLIVITPGVMPLLGWSLAWACGVAVMQAVMRVVSGPAESDRLARG